MPEYGTLQRGRVLGLDASSGGWTVEVVRRAAGRRWGPVLSLVPGLAPGDRVLLGQVGDTADEYVIVGKLAPEPPAGFDLDGWLTEFTSHMGVAQQYREPTALEAANGVLGVERLALEADATSLLAPLGFSVVTGFDRATKRTFALAYSETGTDRSWGAFLLDTSEPIRLMVQAPHPVADQYSELLALDHWRKTPGAILLMAGAHRDATGVQQGGYAIADVCKQVNSMFHQVATAYAARNVPGVQWHGFADASAPGLDKIVATGSGNAGPSSVRVAEELADAGFAVGRGWDSSGSGTGLIGLTNVHGDDMLARGVAWTHVENNFTSRADPLLRARAVDAVVAAQPEVAGVARMLAEAKGGQFPKPVGSANTTGTSPYSARADHIHASRQADLDRITAVETKNTAQDTRLTSLEGKIVLAVSSAAGRPTTGLYDGQMIYRTDKGFHEVYAAGPQQWRIPYQATVAAFTDVEFPYTDQRVLLTADKMIYRYVAATGWIGVQHTSTTDTGHSRYVQGGNQPIPSGVSTKMTFGTYSTVSADVTRQSSNADFVLNRGGVWLVEAGLAWAGAPGQTYRNLALYDSAITTSYDEDGCYNNEAGVNLSVSSTRRFAAGTSLCVLAYHEYGANLSTAQAGERNHVSFTWLRP